MKMNLAENISEQMSEPIGSKPWYPTIHISRKGEEIDLPDEGVMTVTYRKVRSEESKNEKGEERYSCTLELHDIVKVKADKGCCDEEKKEDPYEERGAILDKLRDALTKED